MNTLIFLLVLASSTIDLDIVSVPVSNEIRVALSLGGRAEIKHEDTVTRVRIDIDRVGVPSTHGPGFNTYVVWAVSPEGILDNLGELDFKNGKGQFSATTRLTQFGVLITAEPHYMVDRPSAAVVYRSQSPDTDIRRKKIQLEVGPYDYTQLKPPAGAVPHFSVVQARAAFQIAQAAGAERLAPTEFRNAQVALGSMEELVNRAAPLEILWPTANEAIRWAQRAAAAARASQ
jgi:hypothetical protein